MTTQLDQKQESPMYKIEQLQTQIHINLQQFSNKCGIQSVINNLQCCEKQIRMGGNGRMGLLKIFSFGLLAIGCKQNKYYPHLITLIKQQFFKPGVLGEIEGSMANQIQLINSVSVYSFCEGNQDFMVVFEHILEKMLQGHEDWGYYQMVQYLSGKFGIDWKGQRVNNILYWILGMNERIYIFVEGDYFFILTGCTLMDPSRGMMDSGVWKGMESQREVSQLQYHGIQVSQESTPKFKENQESIRYRKKSHKNSFGGDFEVTGYKQLAKLINKSQYDSNNQNQRPKVKKVFSLKFEMQQMGCLTLQESQNPFKDSSSQIEGEEIKGLKIQKNMVQMRSSNIEGLQGRKQEKRQKGERKRHVTSSQVFNIIHNKRQNNRQVQEQNRQQFKFSFSKKDAGKYVFKEIESQYSQGEFQVQSEIGFEKGNSLQQSMKRELRSSLNLPKQNGASLLLYQGDYFRKHQKNKKSFLFEGSIAPIQEQVQSSQQEQTEEQSICQSQRQIENSEQQEELQHRSKQSVVNGRNQEKNGDNWVSINNKNYINIFKAKNRKFSYLTQPIIGSNNSIQGSIQGGVGMRQSYLQVNQTITQSPQIGKGIKQNLVDKNRGYFNRRQRSPKIHKNSQAITESKPKKRRFQENPISFSQMIANNNQDFNFSGNSVNQKKPARLSLNSNIIQFSKENVMCYQEPFGWIRKQVTYYFPVFDGRLPKRFVIEKSVNLNKTNSQANYNFNNSPPPEKYQNEGSKQINLKDRIYQNMNENPLSSTSLHNMVYKQGEGHIGQVIGSDSCLVNVSNNNSTANNIRSTIDTTLNIQYKGRRGVNDNKSENNNNNNNNNNKNNSKIGKKWFPSSSTNLSNKIHQKQDLYKDKKQNNKNCMIGYFNLNIRKGIKSPHSQKKIRNNHAISPNYAKVISPEHASANKNRKQRDRSFTNLYQSPTNRPIAHPIVPIPFAVQNKTLKKGLVEQIGRQKNRNVSRLSFV